MIAFLRNAALSLLALAALTFASFLFARLDALQRSMGRPPATSQPEGRVLLAEEWARANALPGH